MKKYVIEARNLQFWRGKRKILDVESFGLEEGEVLALLGPNGAGKSTLLQVLALLLKPTRGEVLFRGSLVGPREALLVRRRMAVVFQEPLLLNTTVYENVAAGLKLRGLPAGEIKKRVGHWLARLGIEHLAGRRPHQLSGGEARRVSLARAFVLEPEVLLLDEPFAALDLPTRLALLEDLGKLLRDTGTSTVFVTHDLTEVPHLTGQAALLKEGRLIYRGSFTGLCGLSPSEVARITSLAKALHCRGF
ncbi:ABC transporter ATP-binding protein [Desulfovirgula thermocuniculi]|uniref:ABC transporter ATP-binding protein n=1 Tax=Desulfovirgula thermocuniculi TaxID=348842 RepID=UPI0004112ED6|nr:ATP-binding cassette domain-containing protein [Desulfovirgula thermocuniculi]